jgi:hypothetical protein
MMICLIGHSVDHPDADQEKSDVACREHQVEGKSVSTSF